MGKLINGVEMMNYEDKKFLKDSYGLTDKECASVFRMVRSGFFTMESAVKKVLSNRWSK